MSYYRSFTWFLSVITPIDAVLLEFLANKADPAIGESRVHILKTVGLKSDSLQLAQSLMRLEFLRLISSSNQPIRNYSITELGTQVLEFVQQEREGILCRTY